MSANNVFLVIFLAFVLGTLFLSVFALKWGLKWAGICDISFLRATGLLLVLWLAGSLMGTLPDLVMLVTSVKPPERLLLVLAYFCSFAGACLAVMGIYKVRVWQAGKAIMPYYLVPLSMALLSILVVRPFAYEAFSIPTNGMAPTLLGIHWEAPCPRCGYPAYGMQVNSHFPVSPQGVMMICSNELQSVTIANPPENVIDGDRILVSKLISPRRWDMVVFRYPPDSSVTYVKRLVGLPGEKLSIHDGGVWINDEKMQPPTALAGIQYSPTIEANGQVYSGPGSVPVQLGPDEYFMLGDFVQQSSDSRMWERGAPGHPPYAVPESHIIGVVVNIYWPVNRWKSFR